MRNLTIIIAAIFLSVSFTHRAAAQSAYETMVKYNKENQNAVVAEYNLPEEVVEAAMKERLEKAGLGKYKNSKGFMTYSNRLWSEITNTQLDVYVKIEGKKGKSTVQILISSGNNNFISSGSNPEAIQNLKNFLNNFGTDATSFQLKLDIEQQEALVKKTEKDYNNSIESGKDLVKEKEKLEKKIAENNNQQSLKQKALEEERVKLAGLKGKM